MYATWDSGSGDGLRWPGCTHPGDAGTVASCCTGCSGVRLGSDEQRSKPTRLTRRALALGVGEAERTSLVCTCSDLALVRMVGVEAIEAAAKRLRGSPIGQRVRSI